MNLNFLSSTGKFGYETLQIFLSFRYIFKDHKRIIFQLDHIGVKSIPLVAFIGMFAGGIVAWQAAAQFKGMVSLSLLGGASSRAIAMEMGPVLTSLIVAGRVGASMTAEIGTMNITEQLDALRCMAIKPTRYIAMPRVFSMMIMLPLLVLLANVIGVIGSYVVAWIFLDMSAFQFFESVLSMFRLSDLSGGLVKSFGFALIISVTSCYLGMNDIKGAKGVGEATIKSFVFSSLAILVFDFIIWILIY